MHYLFAFSSALCTTFAWHLPSTLLSAMLGAFGALTLVPLIYKENYKAAYLHGCLCSAIGMHWLYSTIKDFGGFPSSFAFVIFLLFVFSHGLQTPLVVYIFKSLPKKLSNFGLRAAIAWVVVEYLPIRIFPWQIGHSQLAFQGLSQVADLAGSLLVSFILLATAESICNLLLFKNRQKTQTLPLFLFVAALFYSSYKLEYFTSSVFPKIKVELVQANISTVEKSNQKFFESNFQRYKLLSTIQQTASKNTLIIWPETVYTDWLSLKIKHRDQVSILPELKNGNALLFGALTYKDEQNFYNSALLIEPDGSISDPYHKKILMPFGEYMPFAKYLPFLKTLNPMAADFTPGTEQTVFQLKLKDSENNQDLLVKIAPLICYEDVLINLAKNAVQNGANILVNLTNDAWFGNTIAPYQHHLIASFRAIENRRFLLRSTNTGLTAVIDATGRTISQIPTFSEEVLYEKVDLISENTVFNQYLGNYLWLLLLLFSCLHLRLYGEKSLYSSLRKRYYEKNIKQ